ncbi:class I SAM-dependent methyltransferase [Leptolyngbya cf. ectocarpi LEGE 11479]|uniref:Class I SAM-dependent methyltransferase n=1 Tax=Leptolyngbya cf. ectocarpi LEGE 11479 TaxID=1828722 RepID=A0A928ZYG6_LEPEC|nr:class I SAM-dependent methyltransferase [Leptolyngbya ectocarpi]MBE9069809.1 class I SAM-dependent methyltransferase [Leptolyngbya cf. ectocarpi LEGE 11479]
MPSALGWLKLPEISQMQDLDNPSNIHILRRIIQRKPFLKKTYIRFYQDLLSRVQDAPSDGLLVELGSGPGFLKSMASDVVTSDVLPYEGIDRVFSALDMPFSDCSVSAFMMIDVLHHIKDSRQFFREMQRCLKPGGKVVMIEPANTPWSSFIYRNFHHEPFNIKGGWGFEDGGPLSGANMAIPWIVFCRDHHVFAKEFPDFRICSVKYHTPITYLISGGVSMRQILPSYTYPMIQFIEWSLSPVIHLVGMFMTIELENII